MNSQPGVVWGGFFAAVVLALLSIVSQRQRAKAEQEAPNSWKSRPNALCLAASDDEAISFLSFGEGLANLVQFLLHPIGLMAVLMGLLTAVGYKIIAHDAAYSAVFWIGMADKSLLYFSKALVWSISLCLIAATIIRWIFGLPLRKTFSMLTSRILVSYVPLRSYSTDFIPISNLPFSWWKPWQMIHSQIYRCERVPLLIANWVHELCERKERINKEMADVEPELLRFIADYRKANGGKRPEA